MPKPKRRPPVVKTDWVVENVPEKIYVRFDSLVKAKEHVKAARLQVNLNSLEIYERKYRKVDL